MQGFSFFGPIVGGSRTAATSKMEHFVIIVNGFHPLTIIIKSSILNVAAVLDPPLWSISFISYNDAIVDSYDLFKCTYQSLI